MIIDDSEHVTASSLDRTPLSTVLAYIDRYNEADSKGMWKLMSPDFTRQRIVELGTDGSRHVSRHVRALEQVL